MTLLTADDPLLPLLLSMTMKSPIAGAYCFAPTTDCLHVEQRLQNLFLGARGEVDLSIRRDTVRLRTASTQLAPLDLDLTQLALFSPPWNPTTKVVMVAEVDASPLYCDGRLFGIGFATQCEGGCPSSLWGLSPGPMHPPCCTSYRSQLGRSKANSRAQKKKTATTVSDRPMMQAANTMTRWCRAEEHDRGVLALCPRKYLAVCSVDQTHH